MTQEDIEKIVDLVSQANSILVVFPDIASIDQASSAISLHLGLTAAGKNSLLASPLEPTGKLAKLMGIDQVMTKIGNQNLQVVFDYSPEQVDKVSYHIDEEKEKFFLVVQPQKGHQPLDVNKVRFDYEGVGADLIFLVGVKKLEDLEHLYHSYEDVFQSATTISLSTFKTSYANVSPELERDLSLSKTVIELVESLGASVDGDMATNLLAGIEESTQNFQSLTTSADMFEIAAKLMRFGARRLRIADEKSSSSSDGGVKVKEAGGETQLFQAKKLEEKPEENQGEFAKKLQQLTSEDDGKVDRKQEKLKKSKNKKGGLDHQPSSFSGGR